MAGLGDQHRKASSEPLLQPVQIIALGFGAIPFRLTAADFALDFLRAVPRPLSGHFNTVAIIGAKGPAHASERVKLVGVLSAISVAALPLLLSLTLLLGLLAVFLGQRLCALAQTVESAGLIVQRGIQITALQTVPRRAHFALRIAQRIAGLAIHTRHHPAQLVAQTLLIL